jgi:hypothetical protein
VIALTFDKPAQLEPGSTVWFPCATVLLGRLGDYIPSAVPALVDTGAAVSMVSLSTALKIPGVTAAEISSIPQKSFVGANGRMFRCRALRLDVSFVEGWNGPEDAIFTLPEVELFVSDDLTDDIILGQHEVLQRAVFQQDRTSTASLTF